MILIIAMVIYWLFAFSYSFLKGSDLAYIDEKWYFFDYAQNLAKFHIYSRDGITPSSYHPPLYPLLLGVVVKLGFGIIAARLLNFLTLFITLVCIYEILEQDSKNVASLFAVLIALMYPVLFYTAGTLYPQTVGALLLVSGTLFYWKDPHEKTNTFLSGLLMGFSILTIPTFLFVPFFFFLFSLLFRKNAIAKSVLILLIVLLTILPWTIRNYLVFDQFILISSNMGTNFIAGNSPATTPNNGPNAFIGLKGVFNELNEMNLNEFDRNNFLMNKAFTFIREDPKHYLLLYFQKVLNHFNFRNELATISESSILKDFIMLLTYGTLLIISVVRFFFIKKYPLSKLEIFLILLYICYAFVSAIVFTRIRYRLPFDYLLIMFVAIFLQSIYVHLAQATKP
jgi:4-amino-4-deoxy-L-arabinose transferase-like glycosyltransferase